MPNKKGIDKSFEKLLFKYIPEIAGKNSELILKLILGKKSVNEFEIAKKSKMTINQTRNLLYKLSHLGVVSFTRKKDKRKGWYIYYWTIEPLRTLEYLLKANEKEKEKLDSQLKSRISKRFYFCDDCGIEMSEENALLHNFCCTECGKLLTYKIQDTLIKDINLRINEINKENKELEEKINELKEKIRKKAKPLKKEAKNKKTTKLKKDSKKNLKKKI